MVPAAESPPSRLGPVLRSAVQDLHRASGADLTSLFLYDAEAHRYYAPFAVGLPEDGLGASLTDMGEQLEAYLEDLAAGKVPDELRPQHYGTTAWLTVTRRLLVARDATAEADSSFVRRHHVASSIGLPLVSADNLLGLAYLSYKSKEKFPDAKGLKALEQWAAAPAPLAPPLPIALGGGKDRAGAFDQALAAPTEKKAVSPAGTIPLEDGSGAQGYLVGLSRDRLAAARRAPATDILLQGAAALIGGVLYDQRLVAGLGSRTRLLTALADMTTSMLEPGASRQDVLDAVVGHLTDAAV